MTANITLASSSGDSAVLETISQHQAELLGAAAVKTKVFQTAAAGGEDPGRARTDLLAWIESKLLPYLRAETEVLLPALETTAVGEGLRAELSTSNEELLGFADRIATSTRNADTGAAAAALQILAAGGADAQSGTTAHEASKHVCECGILDHDGFPELDVRTVPHAIRHATVFGALDAVEKGSGMVLVARHDPLPLLAQIEVRTPGEFAVDYLDRGPETWSLQFRRAGGVS